MKYLRLFSSGNIVTKENNDVVTNTVDGTITDICRSALEIVDSEIRQGLCGVPCPVFQLICSRTDMLGNIYVSGGSSMIPGIASRLEDELNSGGISGSAGPVKVNADPQRK